MSQKLFLDYVPEYGRSGDHAFIRFEDGNELWMPMRVARIGNQRLQSVIDEHDAERAEVLEFRGRHHAARS